MSKVTMTPQENADLSLLIATYRCFHEQLYNMKGRHRHRLKQVFNELERVADKYEKTVVKQILGEKNEPADLLQDSIQDFMYTLRDYGVGKYIKERDELREGK